MNDEWLTPDERLARWLGISLEELAQHPNDLRFVNGAWLSPWARKYLPPDPPPKPPGACYWCRRRKFWRTGKQVVRCVWCHPPAHPALVEFFER